MARRVTPFNRIIDYRVGVSLEIAGIATAVKTFYRIVYAGHYGFEGDPAPHKEDWPTIGEAFRRWKGLVEDYRDRALGVNRLKAFKKPWVRPPSGANNEAVIWEKDGLFATLSSQGPTTRRKRIWVINGSAPVDEGVRETFTKIIIPYKEAHFPLDENAIAVPISKMGRAIADTWDVLVKAYLGVLESMLGT